MMKIRHRYVIIQNLKEAQALPECKKVDFQQFRSPLSESFPQNMEEAETYFPNHIKHWVNILNFSSIFFKVLKIYRSATFKQYRQNNLYVSSSNTGRI